MKLRFGKIMLFTVIFYGKVKSDTYFILPYDFVCGRGTVYLFVTSKNVCFSILGAVFPSSMEDY